jgi:hypothetical protein
MISSLQIHIMLANFHYTIVFAKLVNRTMFLSKTTEIIIMLLSNISTGQSNGLFPTAILKTRSALVGPQDKVLSNRMYLIMVINFKTFSLSSKLRDL